MGCLPSRLSTKLRGDDLEGYITIGTQYDQLLKWRQEARLEKHKEEQRIKEAKQRTMRTRERERERKEETAPQQMHRPRLDSYDELIALDKEIHCLRRRLLEGEKELRSAERRATMGRRRLWELERCNDPADQTYWTHARVGRDGQPYFWGKDAPANVVPSAPELGGKRILEEEREHIYTRLVHL